MRKFIFILLVLAASCSQDRNKISTEDFSTRLETQPDAVLVDVRTPGEYNEEHLENSINIDYKNENFEKNLQDLARNKTYLLYCRSGRRSGAAAEIMKDMGFEEVYDLEGGILQWKEEERNTVVPE